MGGLPQLVLSREWVGFCPCGRIILAAEGGDEPPRRVLCDACERLFQVVGDRELTTGKDSEGKPS
jgi:hypothetical protein